MAIYLLNFASIPVYDLLFKKKKLIIFLLSTQMFLILALRADTLGVDLDNYKTYFEYYGTLSFWDVIRGFRPIGGSAHDYGVESGYVLFNWLIAKTGLSFHAFLIIYAAIVITSFAVFVDRYCDDPALAFATFISVGGFVAAFGILRQSLGLAILLCAVPALVERKFWKFALIVFAAGLFHQSLLLALFLFFLAKFKANKALYVAVIAISAVLTVFTPVVYNNIVFPLLFRLGKIYYIDGFTWNNMFALILLFTLLLMFFFKAQKKEDNAMQCGFLMTLPVQALAFFIPVFSRLSGAVFINFLCILLPSTVSSLETRSRRLQAKTMAYLGLSAFYVYTLITDNVLVPYIPFWS